MINHKLSDEPARLAALRRYDLVDTPSDGILEKITSLVRTVLKVPIAAVSLVDSDRQWFKPIQGMDANEASRAGSFCSHAIKGVRPLVIPDALKDDQFKNHPFVSGPPHIRSYLGAQLRTPDGYNIGALCAFDTLPNTYSDDQIDILTRFAAIVVDELELRRIGERDRLTHALSRRGFIGQMEKEIKRFDRFRIDSVLAVMDFDHLEKINDKFGHPIGDAVIKDIAATCIFHLRETDVFGRLGGEEFGILLTGTDEAGARSAVEKIRRMIEEQVIPIADGIHVTASFGLAKLQPKTTSAEDWIAIANKALYRAKRSGRNRYVFAVQPEQLSSAEIIRLEKARDNRRLPHSA